MLNYFEDYVVFTDGACVPNPGKMAIGFSIEKNGKEIVSLSKLVGNGTNNIAEYMAVIQALQECVSLGITSIEVKSDSKLIVNQLNGKWGFKKGKHLKYYFSEIARLLKGFERVKFSWIPRESNVRADFLSTTLFMKAVPKLTPVKK